ncbi:uncharacterized protein nek6 isoform X1 [Epinephelus moara]|uniref:uncharacterized protein nek6 isoform X1 n=1 Tax=Epinephelus moara TaxID=300413 RepID=UPI00214E0A14|nr:uncharacterized protein nek6 isoform X1 [Epinephelus moara]
MCCLDSNGACSGVSAMDGVFPRPRSPDPSDPVQQGVSSSVEKSSTGQPSPGSYFAMRGFLWRDNKVLWKLQQRFPLQNEEARQKGRCSPKAAQATPHLYPAAVYDPKVDELQALVRFQHDFRDACLLAITESWLTDRDSDADLSLDGFGAPVRLDCDASVMGKSQGGGVCLYVNQRWCKNVLVRERLCTKGVELLAVSLRPPYLPLEFPQLFVVVAYVHPRANVDKASESILMVTQKLQSKSPDAPLFVLGDFNHCSLGKVLKNLYQYVTCPTSHSKILDMCYGSVKGAYKSLPLPPLGGADHNCVHLILVYRTVLRREKVLTKQTKLWTDDAIMSLQGCYDCTAWDTFTETSSDIDELTDVISSYVTFCEDSVIPKKTFKVFPNNKPRVSKSLKILLNKKKIAFREGNISELNVLQREIKCEISRAKLNYKEMLERKLGQNNLGSAWDGLRTITVSNKKCKSRVALSGAKSDKQLAQDLNEFYLRFDALDFSNMNSKLKNELHCTGSPPLNERSVIESFKWTKSEKAQVLIIFVAVCSILVQNSWGPSSSTSFRCHSISRGCQGAGKIVLSSQWQKLNIPKF